MKKNKLIEKNILAYRNDKIANGLVQYKREEPKYKPTGTLWFDLSSYTFKVYDGDKKNWVIIDYNRYRDD